MFIPVGLDCTFERMDEVRERQEKLARLHFDLDSHHDAKRCVAFDIRVMMFI